MPPTHRSPPKRLSLSPPVWKDQLRQRCLQRLKRDRGQLLAKLRRPGACTSVSEEMQRLVAHEQHVSSCASVDDLLLLGKMRESDYLEIVHALEDALRQDKEEQELRHIANLEDTELEALLAGMDLKEESQEHQSSENGREELQELMTQDISVLCPQCKANYLREETLNGATVPFITCGCGFTFHVQYVYHSVLKDFQEQIVNAFMTHRDSCSADPTFEKEKVSLKNGADALCIKCMHCGCDNVLP